MHDLSNYYLAVTVDTYFDYSIRANGVQRKIFTVLSDESDNNKQNRYFYDGDGQIGLTKKIQLPTISAGSISSLDDVPQGSTTKKLTALEYSHFKDIEATFFTP